MGQITALRRARQQRARQQIEQQKLLETRDRRHPARRPIDQAIWRAAQVNQSDLLQALAALEQENSALRSQLRTDHLTGVFNRAALMEQLQREWQRHTSHGHNSALLLIDLNGFKQINDRFGHTVGDRMLVEAAKYFATQLRTSDMIARLGGDEFAILLRDTDRDDARHVAEKLCALAPRLEFSAEIQGVAVQLEFAIGVAALDSGIDSVLAWIDAADKAMYLHKRSARPPLRCV